jgi:hypothetical protein
MPAEGFALAARKPYTVTALGVLCIPIAFAVWLLLVPLLVFLTLSGTTLASLLASISAIVMLVPIYLLVYRVMMRLTRSRAGFDLILQIDPLGMHTFKRRNRNPGESWSWDDGRLAVCKPVNPVECLICFVQLSIWGIALSTTDFIVRASAEEADALAGAMNEGIEARAVKRSCEERP